MVLRITLALGIASIFMLPSVSSAQNICRGRCEWYFDEFDNPWHRNPVVLAAFADTQCDGDGCHDEWVEGTCDAWHSGCGSGLMGMPSQEALATNNVAALRKLLATKDTPLRLNKDGTVIQLLGCNGRVVMQKTLSKEMQAALKS